MAAEGRFADAGGSENQCARPHRYAIVEQRVQGAEAADERLLRKSPDLAPVFQSGIYTDTARLNLEVVKTSDVAHAAQLRDLEPAPRDSEVVNGLFQSNDAVREAYLGA